MAHPDTCADFLANVSHELRTPLNAILGFADLLHSGELGQLLPPQQEAIGYVLTSGRRRPQHSGKGQHVLRDSAARGKDGAVNGELILVVDDHELNLK